MKAYYEADAKLDVLQGRTLAIIGYGNQGRAQALNLRDSGLNVVIGSIRDESARQAEADGFRVVAITEAAERADVLALLIPDEIQKRVYEESIAGKLWPGQALNFAHGYNIRFGLIAPPPDVDVIMVAPRMLGAEVRESFTRGAGAPAFVAVHQNASGQALSKALAWARGIGATRAGVLETTFAEETELDLFQEQALWPVLERTMLTAFEVLAANGFPPEMVALEMYGSGEAAEIFREMARVGFFKQMRLHSHTSQYGTLSRADALPVAGEIRALMERALEGIRNGRFAAEWSREQAGGYPRFNKLRAQADAHPLAEAEKLMRRMLRMEEFEK